MVNDEHLGLNLVTVIQNLRENVTVWGNFLASNLLMINYKLLVNWLPSSRLRVVGV